MLCAYLSLDEVNQDLAARSADEAGVELDALTFRDAAPAGQFDAVVYDLDSLPPAYRRALLADLGAGQLVEPVAVHSYNLSAGQVRALRRRGVIVGRRLRSRLFDRLLAAVHARRANTNVGEIV
jgi:hypothetical protein